ncbi:hypothetical protein ACFXJ8_43255 [Nonomuraea sp. NPDC059194]|uniref:hypothetical protein n=1 Tax=Nonomuraea sp. NPDC059194 TaxID=3346764 RepID=UPI0036D10951
MLVVSGPKWRLAQAAKPGSSSSVCRTYTPDGMGAVAVAEVAGWSKTAWLSMISAVTR